MGHENLLKRLQAKPIMNALSIQASDCVLDFGCGSGYFTVEMAKLARKAYGIDVIPYVKEIRIPSSMQGKLEYIQTSGEDMPFDNDHFDKVLASEVLPMVTDPNVFLSEIRRVLRPGGQLVICNGAGHPAIREAFARRSRFFRWLEKRYSSRMPSSYEEYCTILQQSFQTGIKNFHSKDEMRELLEKNEFEIITFDCTPGYLTGAYFSWSQFLLYLRTGQTLSQRSFAVKYPLLSIINRFEKKRYEGGFLVVAKNA